MTTPEVKPDAGVEEIARDWEAYEEVHRSTARLFVSERAGAWITVTYLGLSLLGMIHNAMVLGRFGLNFVEFAAPSDFLLAALRDPFVVLASLIPAVGIFVVFKWSARWSMRRSPEKYLRQRRKYPIFTSPRGIAILHLGAAALWAVSFEMRYAGRVADSLRRGEGTKVAVSVSNAGVPPRAFPADSALLITVTSGYVFLYFPAHFEARAIPVENLAYLGRRRAPRVPPILVPGWGADSAPAAPKP